jgi:hypothetical protein
MNLLNPAIAAVREQLYAATSQRNLESVVSEITRVTDKVIRPVSHDLARERPPLPDFEADGAEAAERVSWPGRVVPGSMMPTVFMFASIFLLAVPSAMQIENSPTGTISVLVLASTYAILFWLMRLVLYRFEMNTLAALLVVVAGATAIGAVFFPINLVLQVSHDIGSQSMIFMAQNAAAMFGFQLLQLRRQILLSRLTDLNAEIEILTVRLRQELWITQRDVGLLLHGPIQGAFYAAALKIARAEEVTPSLISEIEGDLQEAILKLSTLPGQMAPDVLTAVDQVKQAWSPALTINTEIDPGALRLLENDAVLAGVVIEVLREAITNVAKHSSASWVEIRMAATSAVLEIEIENQGLPTGSGRASTGLGSELYETVSLAWELISTASSTVLKLTIPAAGQTLGARSSAVGGSQPARSQTSAAATAATSAASKS